MILYFKGLAIMLAILIYPIIFDYIARIITNRNPINDSYVERLAFAYVVTLIIGTIFILPYIVGKVFFGN